MEKPKITKQLAFIAMLLIGVNFLLNVIAILFPQLYIGLFSGNLDPELSLRIQSLLLADAALVLPQAGVCFWSWQQSDISENQATGTLVLTVIFYFVRTIGSILLHFLTIRMAGSAVEVALCSYINNARNLFSFCILAALILICCSASIELYLTKYLTSETLKEEHP